MSHDAAIGEILVPAEEVTEVRRGQKINTERKFFPGYVLVKMELTDEAWHLVAHRWLAPALDREVWYDEPFSALRLFLNSCAVAGLTEDSERVPGQDVDLDVTDAEHEPAESDHRRCQCLREGLAAELARAKGSPHLIGQGEGGEGALGGDFEDALDEAVYSGDAEGEVG